MILWAEATEVAHRAFFRPFSNTTAYTQLTILRVGDDSYRFLETMCELKWIASLLTANIVISKILGSEVTSVMRPMEGWYFLMNSRPKKYLDLLTCLHSPPPHSNLHLILAYKLPHQLLTRCQLSWVNQAIFLLRMVFCCDPFVIKRRKYFKEYKHCNLVIDFYILELGYFWVLYHPYTVV